MENNKTNVVDLAKVKNNTPKKKKPRKKIMGLFWQENKCFL